MEYWTILRGKDGWAYHYFDNILDFAPDHVVHAMEVQFVDRELGLCRECSVAYHPHVMSDRGKLCPVLFCDVYRPGWKPEDLA